MKNEDISADIPDERKKKILEKSKKVKPEEIEETLTKRDIHIIDMHDAKYPAQLKNIGHAPFFLFVRGILRSDMPLIGIVGSRKSTNYAERILEKIIPDTILAGV